MLLALLCAGCGGDENQTPEDMRESGERFGEGSVEFFKGLQQGVESSVGIEDLPLGAVRLHDSVTGLGFKINRANKMFGSVRLYTVFDLPLSGNLRLKAFDASGLEIGRTSLRVDQDADSARHLEFEFEGGTPLGSAKSFELSKP